MLLRFLGTTPDSSTAFNTLASLYHQLLACYYLRNPGASAPFDLDIPEEFSDMKDLFHNFIQWLSNDTKTRTVLFLDSLDQLSAAGNAYHLKWLPTKLPPNMKIVLSTLTYEFNLLTTLRSDAMGLKSSHFVEVADLKETASHEILTRWLTTHHRQLTPEQNAAVAKSLQGQVRALYLKLVFDFIVQWKSYDEAYELERNVKACIQRLFNDLEHKHGKTLVSHAFGFLSASKNGLSEREMEDLLSLDEAVLTDVFQFHVAPVRRLPSVLWSRIRSDVSEYVVDREADGVKVMAWYHRQFIETARERYYTANYWYTGQPTSEQQRQLYDTIVEYFSGKWAGDVEKPFRYTEHQMKKLGLASAESAAKRYVASQPTVFPSADGHSDIYNIRFNRRKITELVDKTCNSKTDEKLLTELITGNVEMLMGFVHHHPWTEVINALMDGVVNDGEDRKQVSLVQKALLMSHTTFRGNVTMLGPSLQSRLLVYSPSLAEITALMRNIDTVGLQYCALLNPSMQMESPAGEMVFVMNNHQGPVMDMLSTHDGMLSSADSSDDEATISVSQKLVAIDMEVAEIICDVTPLIPKLDCFHKVVFVSKMYVPSQPNVCVGALRDHPWLYIFSVMQDSAETLGIIKLDEITENDSFYIHEIWPNTHEEIYVIGRKEVLVFHELQTGGKLLGRFSAQDDVACSSFRRDRNEGDRHDRLLLVHKNCSASLVQHAVTGNTTMKRSSFTQLASVALPQHEDISAHTTHGKGACLMAFDDGTICLVRIQDGEAALHVESHSIGLGKVHFIATTTSRQFLRVERSDVVLCTESQLVLLQARQKEADYKVAVKVNKRYNGAKLSDDSARIVAYVDGTVDVFEVSHYDKIRQLVSIDAHGATINKLMMTRGEGKCLHSALNTLLYHQEEIYTDHYAV